MHDLGLPAWCPWKCFSKAPSELSELTSAVCEADKQCAAIC